MAIRRSVPVILSRALRFFRAPRTIVGWVLVIAASGVLMTVVPQVTGSGGELRRFTEDSPRWALLARVLGLDRVVRTPWFLALVALAAISLGMVLVAQWRRLWWQWREPVTELSFRGAPFRRELERAVPEGQRKAQVIFRTRGRAGLAGSPLFHLGLMLAVTAGLIRMLFGSDAMVDLFEGETLPAAPGAYGAQWQGPLATPFALPVPLRFEKLLPERYASGEVRRLAATTTVLDPAGSREIQVEVNTPLDLGGERLFLTAAHGPAVLVELKVGEQAVRRALLLRPAVMGAYEARSLFPDGHEVRLRGAIGPE
ncbi:MAG: cytochrome c biogenesis protein ResB, partial [Myxococcaceae bacterium]